ncbi:fimbrial protein [Arvimicrobium flavum]|uniref:fimbrial protein n=1 Tax=Arvimicrobium flavum TaxID=3393320 RepID=UPI00237BAD54|nr:fimbrial protein [Mesorhizobium shangrilense]
MSGPVIDDNQEKPLDPATERVRRKLVRFVAINLGLLFAAVIVVMGAVVYKSMKESAPPPVAASDVAVPTGEMIEATISVPAGARIVSQSLFGNRVSLELELPNAAREILVYDFGERRIIARLHVEPE